MAKRDYYEVLGVAKDASDADIKKSFRRLARELHPDVNPEPAAGEQFREAAEAYEVLSNPDTRARYDRFGHAGVSQSQLHTDQFMDFSSLSDLLGAFFGDDMFGGMAGGGRGRRRGSDAQVEVELTLVEAAFGVTRTVEADLVAACDVCEGSRRRAGYAASRRVPPAVAPVAYSMSPRPPSASSSRPAACAACGGRGQKIAHPCKTCRGRGVRRTRSPIEVQIPAGIADGQRMRLSDRGHVDEPGVQPGDLYVGVSVATDPRFSATATTWCRCSSCRSARRRWEPPSRSRRWTVRSRSRCAQGPRQTRCWCCGERASRCWAAGAAATTGWC